MKRRRFISCRDKTTSFHQGSNAQIEELVPRSSLQQGVGDRGGETREGGRPADCNCESAKV